MNAKRLIRKKRLGEALSTEEITGLVHAFTAERVPDYQMSAWLMTVVWRGMNPDETFALTRAMIDSGRTLKWTDLRPTADKHSTGGVGDKVSLALAPLVASAGVRVPMLSGRGLGHTGGTLDKLEAIPGFTARLDGERFARVLRDVGCVMGGQSGELAPADGLLYALRDATETVESLPLIVSSILSKKVAAGPETLVLDVKVGRGAFMPDRDRARELARLLVATGHRFGLRIVAMTTDMDVPLGRAIGNAIETNEAVDMLLGRDVSADFRELTLLLASAMLVGARRSSTLGEARDTLEARLASGSAHDRFARMIEAQGGDAGAALEGELPLGRRVAIAALKDGVVADVDPRAIATIVTDLGGGRREMTDRIDPSVGVYLDARPGERIARGAPLATLHLPSSVSDDDPWVDRVRAAYTFGHERRVPLVMDVVGPGGEVEWTGWETRLPFD